ncbi:MAG TPA: Gfo/Idh/MocA family oxidoreductase [Propionibacteriaceae bacterium]|nr:Gfo/Idh/MocA family oxidoreductase [Propionibacteriaceae bacterium]
MTHVTQQGGATPLEPPAAGRRHTGARPQTRTRFVLVGAGVIGKQHSQVVTELADRIDLVAVVDVHPDRAEKVAAEHGAATFASLTQALTEVDTDVVSICTPTGTHGPLAIEALRAGRHVIIEKPAEITLAKTDEIIAAQREAGTLVAVISQHRFDRSTEIAVAAIERGALGRLTSGIASIDWWRGQSYYDSGDWRGTWELDGGGALMNQGVHTVDLLVATLGRPVEVFAYTGTLAHQRIEVEDVAVGVVRFESGALGVLHATTAAYPGLSARLQVHGDKGSVVIDNDELAFIHLSSPDSDAEEKMMGKVDTSENQVANYVTEPKAGASAGSDPGALWIDSHRRQYENFLATLAGQETLRVDLETNRQAIAIITGAYESARTGRPVSLV